MKILFIGSSSDFHIDLWTKFFTKKHKVYLFSEKENYLGNKPFENVHIFYSSGVFGFFLNFFKSSSHKLFQLNKLVSAYIYGIQINRIIKKNNIDIVHAHNLYQGYVASYIKKEIPVVFTPMGSDVIIHAQKNFIYRYMAKKAFKRANIVTSDSKLLQKSGLKVGAKNNKNFIIQNGVDSSIFYPKENNIKNGYGIKDDEILIFSPRGLDKIYNIDLILEAISLLKDQGYKVKCMIAYGFGEQNLLSLKKIISNRGIEDNIIWIGGLRYEEMPNFYNASDIVISIPSSDSSPKSVYEAMFCKKLVIVSDLDWVYERLDYEDCVQKVNHKNPEDIAAVIIKLITNHNLAELMSENALEVAKKYYDYEENMKKMEELMLAEVSNYK